VRARQRSVGRERTRLTRISNVTGDGRTKHVEDRGHRAITPCQRCGKARILTERQQRRRIGCVATAADLRPPRGARRLARQSSEFALARFELLDQPSARLAVQPKPLADFGTDAYRVVAFRSLDRRAQRRRQFRLARQGERGIDDDTGATGHLACGCGVRADAAGGEHRQAKAQQPLHEHERCFLADIPAGFAALGDEAVNVEGDGESRLLLGRALTEDAPAVAGQRARERGPLGIRRRGEDDERETVRQRGGERGGAGCIELDCQRAAAELEQARQRRLRARDGHAFEIEQTGSAPTAGGDGHVGFGAALGVARDDFKQAMHARSGSTLPPSADSARRPPADRSRGHTGRT
jgi:hypothetical protein